MSLLSPYILNGMGLRMGNDIFLSYFFGEVECDRLSLNLIWRIFFFLVIIECGSASWYIDPGGCHLYQNVC